MLRLAREGVLPGEDPVPGDARRHRPQLPRGARRPATSGSTELGVQLIVASVAGGDRPRHGRASGRTARRNRIQTAGAARRHREAPASTPLFGGARRDEEKARAKERVFSFRDEFGQWDPKNQRPELWNLYNGRHPPGRAASGSSRCRTGPSSTSGTTSRREEHRDPVDLLRPRARGRSSATGCCSPSTSSSARATARTVRRADGALPHRRRRDPAPAAVRVRRRHRRQGHRRGRRRPGSPSAAPPAATTGSARPPWRTARRRATSDGTSAAVRHRRLGRRRQVHPHRAAAATTPSRSSRTSSRPSSGQPATAGDDYTDLALLTDGLRAEREQGITIDVAYRYFATPARKFIIADTPGHIQYTRNMVTGASTADLGAGARRRPQGPHRAEPPARRSSRRCCGCRTWCCAVNKMDLVDYVAGGLRADPRRVHRLRDQAATSPTSTVIPISALQGDNVVTRSRATCPGTTARRCCTTSSTSTSPATATWSTSASRCSTSSARSPTQYHDYRGYAGQVAGGVLKPGDEVVVLPVGLTSTIAAHRHRRRGGRRGVPADVGHGPARGRRRRLAAAT